MAPPLTHRPCLSASRRTSLLLPRVCAFTISHVPAPSIRAVPPALLSRRAPQFGHLPNWVNCPVPASSWPLADVVSSLPGSPRSSNTVHLAIGRRKRTHTLDNGSFGDRQARPSFSPPVTHLPQHQLLSGTYALRRRVSPEGPQHSGGRACALTRVGARGIQNLKLVLGVRLLPRRQAPIVWGRRGKACELARNDCRRGAASAPDPNEKHAHDVTSALPNHRVSSSRSIGCRMPALRPLRIVAHTRR
jgi:hypothetical protein